MCPASLCVRKLRAPLIAAACLVCHFFSGPSPSTAQEIRGSVRDRTTGAPLVNVLVRVDSLGAVTLTDEAGWFILRRIPKGDRVLSFEVMGYEPSEVAVRVPRRESLEILMAPSPIELPGFEVRTWPATRQVSYMLNQMDLRLARLPGNNRVVGPEQVRLYDSIQAKDPWKLLYRELRIPWRFGILENELYEVYVDDRRTWLANLIFMPNSLVCRIEQYTPPRIPGYVGPPDQLRAYTCLFMAEVAEGRRQMRTDLNWGDLIAGPGNGKGPTPWVMSEGRGRGGG